MKCINSETKIISSLGGIFPILIIILSSISATNIAALPEEIESVYLTVAFSFFINFDLTVIESPIFAWNDVKSISGFLYKNIFSSMGFSSSFLNFWVTVVFAYISFIIDSNSTSTLLIFLIIIFFFEYFY